jgi:hypothetical protein
MGATAKLHSLGESYIGYPCIEVKDIKAGLMAAAAAGDYSAKGAYVAKSWKVRTGRQWQAVCCHTRMHLTMGSTGASCLETYVPRLKQLPSSSAV